MKGLTLTAKEQNRLQVLNGVLERRWSLREAAEVMGVSERQGWRLLAAYRQEGASSLVHKNRGRVPPNATPAATQQRVVALAQERYSGINHTQLTELLAEQEGMELSRPTVRRLLVRAGLSSPRHRRPPRHRCRRQRMPQEGMLLQLDGSHHAWLEDRGPWLTLLLAVDDATGTAPYALFREQEDTRGYMSLLQGIIERPRSPPGGVHRWPCSLPAPAFPSRVRFWLLGEDSQPNGAGPWGSWGSPRYWPTAPRRKDGWSEPMAPSRTGWWRNCVWPSPGTLAEANQVLAEFLPRFNQRFGVPSVQPESAYRPLDPELDLGGVLCIKELRRVAKDNTVQYHGRTLQLFPGMERPSYAGARVEVQERLDGRLLVRHRNQILTPQEAPVLASELRARIPAGPVMGDTSRPGPHGPGGPS